MQSANTFDATWSDTQSVVQRESRAKAEHLRLILNQSIFVFLGNLVASVALLAVTWETLPTLQLTSWTALTVGFNTVRLVVGRNFSPEELLEREIATWEKRFIASTLISGLLWGTAGWNFFIAILIISLAAAATTSHSYHRIAYPLFFVPAITPLAVNLLLEPALAAKAIGCIIPIYFLFLYLLSRRIYQSTHNAIISGMKHHHHAMHDYLTGVSNRRAFQDWLDKEWARALRTRKPLALIIADIDDFKRYNDNYGHASGDKILQVVATTIQGRIRTGTDLLARIGGEEFAVILPETTLTDARAIAEDIRNRTHKLELRVGEATAVPTLSIGVAAIEPSNAAAPAKLFDYADQSLYEAKRQGKNRVVAVPASTGIG